MFRQSLKNEVKEIELQLANGFAVLTRAANEQRLIELPTMHEQESDFSKKESLLVALYRQFYQLMAHTQALRKADRAADKACKLAHEKAIHDLLLSTHKHAIALRNDHPDVWQYLLSQHVGIYCLSYLIFLRHNDNVESAQHALYQSICADLARQPFDEQQRLSKALLYLINQQEPLFSEIKSLINTKHLTNKAQAEVLGEQLKAVAKILDKLPSFIQQQIKLQFTHRFIAELENNQLPIKDKANLLFEFALNIRIGIPGHALGNLPIFYLAGLYEIGNIARSLSVTYCSFIPIGKTLPSLYLDFSQWHIYQYELLDSPIGFQTRLQLAKTVGTLVAIAGNSQANKNNSMMLPNFWPLAAEIYASQGFVSIEFIALHQQHTETILRQLLALNDFSSAAELLSDFIELSAYESESNRQNKLDLLSLLRFMATDNSDKAQVDDTLTKVQLGTLNFSSLEKQSFYSTFASSDNLIQGVVSHASSFASACQIKQLSLEAYNKLKPLIALYKQALNYLKADKKSHKQLSDLFHEEWFYEKNIDALLLFDDEQVEKSGSKKKKKKNKKKARKSQATAEKRSEIKSEARCEFFQSNTIAREKIPPALLKFAQQLKQQTGRSLILTGGAVTALYLNRPEKINDYDCLIEDIKLEVLSDLLAKLAIESKIIGKTHPILSVNLKDKKSDILVEISPLNKKGASLQTALQQNMARRDFNLGALYIILDTKSRLEIYGFKGAINSIKRRQLRSCKPPQQSFSEDPIRLFRLSKLSLDYPDFEVDQQIIHALKKLDVEQILSEFIKEQPQSTAQGGRINHEIQKLLSRYPEQAVLKKLDELNLLAAVTGLNQETIDTTCAVYLKLSEKFDTSYTKKIYLYYALSTVYCLQNPEAAELSSWPFYQVCRHIKPCDQAAYEYIQAVTQFEGKGLFLNNPILTQLIDELTVSLTHEANTHPANT